DGCATIQELLVYRSEVIEGPHMLCLFCGQSYRGLVRRQRRGLPNAYAYSNIKNRPDGRMKKEDQEKVDAIFKILTVPKPPK
ncbi:MAG: hypothetical protein IJ714_00325, partial [Bacteroidales bacterium]|nr:hypothetical protein [Bacteroidales bacterium]